MARLLVVDDESNMRRDPRRRSSPATATRWSRRRGSRARAARASRARRSTSCSPTSGCPTATGSTLLASCREVDPTVPVVLITAFATVELAVEAMRSGAFDVVPKPFVPEAVRAVVERACERTELLRENERLRGPGPPARAGRPRIWWASARRCGELRELIAPRRADERHRADHAARPGPARSSWPARSTTASAARRPPVRGGQLRRVSRDAPRERAVRPRARRVHRRRPGAAGRLRGRAPRHALPRRGRRDAAAAAGQAPARPDERGGRARRRDGAPARGREDHRRHEPGPASDGARRDRSARTSTTGWPWSRSRCRPLRDRRERHPASWSTTSSRSSPATSRFRPGRSRRPRWRKLLAIRLSRQRPRAAQPDRARRDPGRGAAHRGRGPAARGRERVLRRAGSGPMGNGVEQLVAGLPDPVDLRADGRRGGRPRSDAPWRRRRGAGRSRAPARSLPQPPRVQAEGAGAAAKAPR